MICPSTVPYSGEKACRVEEVVWQRVGKYDRIETGINGVVSEGGGIYGEHFEKFAQLEPL